MNTTIILRALGAPGPSFQGFLERLGVALEERSFRVLGLPPKSSNGKLFRLWQANLLLVIADRSLDRTFLEPTLRFFHSFKRAEQSLAVIAAIVQEMLLNRDGINYSLAKKWEHIIRPTYFRLLQDSEVPAVLLELHGSSILEEVRKRLENRIVEGITRYFRDLYQEVVDVPLGNCSSYKPETDDIAQSLANRKGKLTEVKEEIDSKGENGKKAIVSLAEQTREKISPLDGQKGEDVEEVQEEGQKHGAEMKSKEKEPQEEEVKEVSHKGEKQLDKETPKLELPLTEAKLKRRRRYWGSNPLAPPGDGPIYYFEPYIPAEVPPSVPPNSTAPSLRIPDPLSSLKELAWSLRFVTKNEKTK